MNYLLHPVVFNHSVKASNVLFEDNSMYYVVLSNDNLNDNDIVYSYSNEAILKYNKLTMENSKKDIYKVIATNHSDYINELPQINDENLTILCHQYNKNKTDLIMVEYVVNKNGDHDIKVVDNILSTKNIKNISDLKITHERLYGSPKGTLLFDMIEHEMAAEPFNSKLEYTWPKNKISKVEPYLKQNKYIYTFVDHESQPDLLRMIIYK